MAFHPGSLLHAIRSLPAPYLAARALGRLGVGGAWRRRVEFLWARDARVLCKAPDILTRALHDAGLEPAAFARRLAGARVLEIGCGRHIGMAAYAAAAGARRYIGVDPGLSPELLRDPKVVADYLEPALAANRRRVEEHLGDGVPRTLHAAAFAEMIDVRRAGVAEALANEETVDVCLSISCLEHIGDLAEAARTMARLSSPDTLHLHIVNFSNHLSKSRPFEPLYEAPFDRFVARWGPQINGLRFSDVERTLQAAGLPVTATPLDRRPDALPKTIDASWRERYERDDLAVRTALLATPLG